MLKLILFNAAATGLGATGTAKIKFIPNHMFHANTDP